MLAADAAPSWWPASSAWAPRRSTRWRSTRWCALQIEAVAIGGSLRIPDLFSRSCLDGDCCDTFWDHLAAPLDSSIGYLSIYSQDRRHGRLAACLDPSAEHLEIKSSHCGMGMNPGAYRGIADALRRFGKRGARKARGRKPTRLDAVA